ncbi:MAG: hypothetical protein U0790_16795 [Isosphaeraceae bacterium]
MAWADDFHHSAIVALTGNRHAYYADYRGTPQEFVSSLKRGWLYQGQRNVRQGKRRGSSPARRDPSQFIFYLQNHDQLANSLTGDRISRLAGPPYRAMTAVWLLSPQVPMFFQGQEFAATTPFLYFMDHHPELAEAVRRGHDEFLMQFQDLAQPEIREKLPDPGDPSSFTRSKLDHSGAHSMPASTRPSRPAAAPARGSRTRAGRWTARDRPRVVRDPLRRAQDGRPAARGESRAGIHARRPGRAARRAAERHRVDDPLVQPGAEYGGSGCPPLEADDGWHIPGQTAALLRPCPRGGTDPRAGGDHR